MNRNAGTVGALTGAAILLTAAAVTGAAAPSLDQHGQAVVRLAGDEYNRIVRDSRVVPDRNVAEYVRSVAAKLTAGHALPKGVSLSVTVVDNSLPEVYSLSNGVIFITSGALLSLENEAQLAAVLSHEAAHVVDLHYPSIYMAFKEGERKERSKALAAGLASVVVGAALDYTVQTKTNDVYADLEAGDIGYRQAMKKVSAIEAGAGVLEGFSDVYAGLPPETRAGSGDPRLPLEMVADARGLELMARAGYDPGQAGEAWRRIRAAADRERKGSKEALIQAFLPPEMRALMSGVGTGPGGIRAESLTRTISSNPPDRPIFLDSLARSREIAALKKGTPVIGREEFAKVIGGFVLSDAKAAFDAGDYGTARGLFKAAWDSGFQTAEVAYSLGRSQVGEFAFAASEREKAAAEDYLLKATRLDPAMPDPYRALGELYAEWERYGEAAAMYRKYLKASPKAADRERVQREIDKNERKSGR